MKKISFVIIMIVFMLIFAVQAGAHAGGTDANGGHNSPDDYHYHHGYPAHDHINGKWPYDPNYKTSSQNGSTSNNSGGSTKPEETAATTKAKAETTSKSNMSEDDDSNGEELLNKFIAICVLWFVSFLCFIVALSIYFLLIKFFPNDILDNSVFVLIFLIPLFVLLMLTIAGLPYFIMYWLVIHFEEKEFKRITNEKVEKEVNRAVESERKLLTQSYEKKIEKIKNDIWTESINDMKVCSKKYYDKGYKDGFDKADGYYETALDNAWENGYSTGFEDGVENPDVDIDEMRRMNSSE